MKKHNSSFIIVSIVIISFFINLFWEVLHSLLYNWDIPPLQNNIYLFIPKILLATFGDSLYILVIFLIISIFRKKVSWVYFPKRLDYAALMALGLSFAAFIEIKANLLNLWSYNSYMPQFLGIGLIPFIQLGITSILTLLVLNKFIYNKIK